MRFAVLIVLVISSSVTGFGQINIEQTKLHYDSDWNLTSPNLPSYKWISGINKVDLHFQGPVIVSAPDGQVILRGQFAKGKKTRSWILNYGNGVTFAEGEFRGDRKKGRWEYRYPDNTPMQEVEFAGRSFRVISSIDSLGNDRINGASGTWKWYHYLGKRPVIYSGTYLDNQRTGHWSIVDRSSGDTLLTEEYDEGNFVAGQSIFKDTTIFYDKPYFTSEIFDDRFIGKMEHLSYGPYAAEYFYPLMKFLPAYPSKTERNLFSKIEEIFEYIAFSYYWIILDRSGFNSGKVDVSFVIDEQGRCEAFRVIKGLSPEINEIITKSFYQMPRWDITSDEIPIGSPYFLTITIE